MPSCKSQKLTVKLCQVGSTQIRKIVQVIIAQICAQIVAAHCTTNCPKLSTSASSTSKGASHCSSKLRSNLHQEIVSDVTYHKKIVSLCFRIYVTHVTEIVSNSYHPHHKLYHHALAIRSGKLSPNLVTLLCKLHSNQITLLQSGQENQREAVPESVLSAAESYTLNLNYIYIE